MITKEQKLEYINLLKDTSSNDPLLNDVISFIDSYDGTNEIDFKKLILSLVSFFIIHGDLKIDSETLSKLTELDAQFEISAEELRKDYKAAQNGDIRSNYPVPN
jgi:hypothetical protein